MASVYANQLREELDEINEEMAVLRKNGQEYAITGSHSRRGVSWKDLRRRRNEIVGMLARLNNGKSTVEPDYS